MQNIYALGSMEDWLTQAQAAGLGNANAIDNSQEGRDAGLEVTWAIQQAGDLNETTIMQKLQHLDINTLGILWNRNPSNYEDITAVEAAMEIINPDGWASLYK